MLKAWTQSFHQPSCRHRNLLYLLDFLKAPLAQALLYRTVYDESPQKPHL
jgi:hypothetical protein